ncbi:MAG: hypothetical protein V4550_10580 [Gemmatimonadota bacterium]
MTQPGGPNELETAILAVYRGPLDEFVSRRDALVKQLRATKQRDAADRVKALRKPSRIAWVLDSVVHEDPASVEQLAAAIKEAQTGADLRTALDTMKAAVRGVAAVGARVALRAGQPIEPNVVVTALYAIIGDASAFADLRAGLLVEVPEAGGLDMLAAAALDRTDKTTSPSPAPPPQETGKPDARAEAAQQETEAAKQNAELAKAARAELRRAEASFATASERSEHAERAVLKAQEKLDDAERALRHAQSEAESRRADLERARNSAATAAAELRDAEQAVATSRARVVETEG